MRALLKSSFFRQSGWMMIATFTGGLFMAAVQFVAVRSMVKDDSNTFGDLLRLLMAVGVVPSAALQTIFAQQAAAAVTDQARGKLTASVRALLRTSFMVWAPFFILTFIFAGPCAEFLNVNSPNALRMTVLAVLTTLWVPSLKGLLQGLHRFTWMGSLMILEGVIRISMFLLLVAALKGGALGGVASVVIGQWIVVGTSLWITRDVWSRKTAETFSWKEWRVRGVPLSLGMGTNILMCIQVDFIFVNRVFKSNPGHVQWYYCAMLIGFAITQFVAPMAAVMFPTIVRNQALANKSDPLLITLGVTAGFSGLAAIGCLVVPWLPVRILFSKYPEAAQFVPWYACALVPLTLANVLVQNLLAREKFTFVPWLVAVPILYVASLYALAPYYRGMADDLTAMKAVIATMGAFNTLLFGVAAWFTWGRKSAAVV